MVLHTHLQTSHSSRTTLLRFLTFLYIYIFLWFLQTSSLELIPTIPTSWTSNVSVWGWGWKSIFFSTLPACQSRPCGSSESSGTVEDNRTGLTKTIKYKDCKWPHVHSFRICNYGKNRQEHWSHCWSYWSCGASVASDQTLVSRESRTRKGAGNCTCKVLRRPRPWSLSTCEDQT